ncbi:hypothetical protein BJ508DRAFT_149943 [Ascobolus immersus RN42]|uniref:Uncharacterized protein n=1 Tax=Ascobolus immersus RN42 TaxID=1160509 RepID=A0A3N4IB83_ASCIM|nr:hypothetical protein BJ508DRAFT_149943 [Ascobolus immersus RN42]
MRLSSIPRHFAKPRFNPGLAIVDSSSASAIVLLFVSVSHGVPLTTDSTASMYRQKQQGGSDSTNQPDVNAHSPRWISTDMGGRTQIRASSSEIDAQTTGKLFMLLKSEAFSELPTSACSILESLLTLESASQNSQCVQTYVAAEGEACDAARS